MTWPARMHRTPGRGSDDSFHAASAHHYSCVRITVYCIRYRGTFTFGSTACHSFRTHRVVPWYVCGCVSLNAPPSRNSCCRADSYGLVGFESRSFRRSLTGFLAPICYLHGWRSLLLMFDLRGRGDPMSPLCEAVEKARTSYT